MSDRTPLYGGTGQISIRQERSEASRSVSSHLSMPGHVGTHIDAPKHFDERGKTLDQFPADFWISHRSMLIDVIVEPGEILELEKVGSQLQSIPHDCDLLLLRTGAEKWRKFDPEVYTKKGPGVGPGIAKWLRRNRRIKFLGLDFISVSSFSHREIGRAAHRELLSTNEEGLPPILPIEDMNLENLKAAPSLAIISPLLFENADGAPVMVLGEVNP